MNFRAKLIGSEDSGYRFVLPDSRKIRILLAVRPVHTGTHMTWAT